jgi:hypothetical protein
LGFGAQTVDSELAKDIRLSLIAAGTQKLGDKNCHAIFVNRVGAPDTGIATATNAGVLLFAREGPPQVVESGEPIPKLELARWLLAEIDRAPEFRRLAGKGFHG